MNFIKSFFSVENVVIAIAVPVFVALALLAGAMLPLDVAGIELLSPYL